MTTIATLPKPFYEFAFNTDPTSTVPPLWQDLSNRVWFVWDTKRGRQYELDVNETGEWTVRLANLDGALNPASTTGPFDGGVKLYRQARIRVPMAPTQNLLPQIIATGSSSMSPTADAVGNWWYSSGPGTLAQGLYLAAAPSGQSVAVAWTTPSGTTSTSSVLYVGAVAPNAAAAGPVADVVQVAAGTQYTASAYLTRATSADATVQVTVGIAWFNVAGTALTPSMGAAVTVPTGGSWVRGTVTGTAPAGAVWGRITVAITSPASTTAANTVYGTGWQMEAAAAATAWADPGFTGFIFSGFNERMPQAWTELDGGIVGTAEPIIVDAFDALATYTLQSPFVNEVLALKPNFFYQLAEPAGSTSCADSAGQRIAAPVENSPYGAGSLTFGNAITANNPPSGLFIGTAGPVATFNNNPNGSGQNVQENETFVSIHKTTATPGPPANGNWTRIIHFRCSTAPTSTQAYEFWSALPPTAVTPTNNTFMQMSVVTGANTGTVFITVSGTTGIASSYQGTANLCDGNWHQLALTVDGSGNTAFYVDGSAVIPGTSSIALPMSGVSADVLGASIQIGAGYYRSGMVGDMTCAAEFPAALTAAQISNLYNSWRTASTGDSTGARYQRVLNWIGWNGTTRIDTGATTSMGPATDLTGDTALDALNAITVTEAGDHYAATNGQLTFKARTARYNQRTPVYTFGEGPPVGAAGEWPCEVARIEYDASHLANTVQVTQWTGPVFTAKSPASAGSYFPRTYQRTVNTTSGPEAQDAANYLLGQLKDPHLRPDVIVLHPSAIPGLFAVCLQLEKGLRIRLIKRPIGSAAITVDCFVERVEWQWDPDTGDVVVQVQASPADLANYGVLAALHTTLNLQAASGQNKATINALPDAAVNQLAQSLPSGYSLTFEPGTPRQETLALAAGGIPVTALNYVSAQLTFATNFAFTHNAGTIVCEPLPTGYTDPTAWDASAVIGAAYTTVVSGGGSGTNTVTVGPLQDAAYNALGSNWNTGDQITLSPGTPNVETVTVASVATTYPGYTTCQITLTANLAHSHAVGDWATDPLPGGVSSPTALAPTLRLAY